MSNSPLISVITPTLNSNSSIRTCLKSVTSQTYKNIEHIVVDGLSSDSTLEIIKSFQPESHFIRLLSEKDNGIYDAMNKGIDLAKGDWLYFLGSDDELYDKNVFYDLLPILSDPRFDIIYGNVKFRLSETIYNGRYNKFKLLSSNICHQSIFTRKSVFEKLGNFDLKYRTYSDWHFNMKWFNDRALKHHYTNMIIAYFFEGGHSKKREDAEFNKDFSQNVERYFPGITFKMYKYRHNLILNNLIRLLT